MSDTQSTVDWITERKVDWMIARIEEWISIRERYVEGNPSMADVGHSALLRRLLSGHKALVYPPPRSFSYSNYRAAEGHEFKPLSVFFSAEHFAPSIDMETLLEGEDVPGCVVIDQASWEVVGREGDTFFIKWRSDPLTWSLRFAGTITTEVVNQPTHQWILQRLVNEEFHD